MCMTIINMYPVSRFLLLTSGKRRERKSFHTKNALAGFFDPALLPGREKPDHQENSHYLDQNVLKRYKITLKM